MTVSNAADRSRRIRTEERDEALAVANASVTARRAVFVECPDLKLDILQLHFVQNNLLGCE